MFKVVIYRRNNTIVKKYYYEDMFMFRKWLTVHRSRFPVPDLTPDGSGFNVRGFKLNCTCTPQDHRYVNSGPLEWQECE